MNLSMIIATGKNGEIGLNNSIPWKSSTDMQWFREQTMGKVILMGRKTWQSLGKALPGRINIVISRAPEFEVPAGVLLVPTPEEAIRIAAEITRYLPTDEVMVIGGAEIYKALFPSVNKIYLTQVDYDGWVDTYFEVDTTGFEDIYTEEIDIEKTNQVPLSWDERDALAVQLEQSNPECGYSLKVEAVKQLCTSSYYKDNENFPIFWTGDILGETEYLAINKDFIPKMIEVWNELNVPEYKSSNKDSHGLTFKIYERKVE